MALFSNSVAKELATRDKGISTALGYIRYFDESIFAVEGAQDQQILLNSGSSSEQSPLNQRTIAVPFVEFAK